MIAELKIQSPSIDPCSDLKFCAFFLHLNFSSLKPFVNFSALDNYDYIVSTWNSIYSFSFFIISYSSDNYFKNSSASSSAFFLILTYSSASLRFISAYANYFFFGSIISTA